ncbi:hypothetical protein ACEQ8H_004518 [Pleosporales sp. CAS-2024a]
MASKLVPSDPAKVMVIRDVVPRQITTLSVPFWRFGRIKIGGRSTIVRLQSGALAVFSPVALTDDVKAKVAELGQVKYIAALDAEHHLFLGPWHAAYPAAHVLGPETLREKRAKQHNEAVPFTFVFRAPDGAAPPVSSISPEFDAEFDWEYVHGHVNKEIVFHHRPSRTLIQADLLFNLPATEQFSRAGVDAQSGVLTRVFGALQSAAGEAVWQKRIIWYGTSRGDRGAFHQSVARIHTWPFERIVPCHGDVIEGNAKSVFEKVFGWHLDAAKKGE